MTPHPPSPFGRGGRGLSAPAVGPVAIDVAYDLAGGYEVAWGVLFCGFVASGGIILFARPARKVPSSGFQVPGLDSKP